MKMVCRFDKLFHDSPKSNADHICHVLLLKVLNIVQKIGWIVGIYINGKNI